MDQLELGQRLFQPVLLSELPVNALFAAPDMTWRHLNPVGIGVYCVMRPANQAQGERSVFVESLTTFHHPLEFPQPNETIVLYLGQAPTPPSGDDVAAMAAWRQRLALDWMREARACGVISEPLIDRLSPAEWERVLLTQATLKDGERKE